MGNCRLHTRLSKEDKDEFDEIFNKLGYPNHSEFIMSAVRALNEFEFVTENNNVLNKHILSAIDGTVRSCEQRLGNRFSKLMSEMIIQMTILTTIQKMNNHLTDIEIEQIRVDVVRMLEVSQSVLKYNSL